MSSLKENNLQIAKLNSANYSIWKFRMEMILIKEDLYDLIENETPADPNETFKKRDRQARALINLCIDDSQVIHIKYEKTAKDTWNKLKSIHERTNLSSKLFLLRKLYSAKLAEDGNMIEHIANMLELVDKLKAVGEDIKDDHIAALLLVSVPKSYDNLITALEARSEGELTPELIKNKLTDEYNRRKELNAERKTSQVYRINEKQNAYKPHQNYTKNNKFCTYCKKSGHTRENCYYLLNKNKANNFRKYNDKSDKQIAEKSTICFSVNPESKAEVNGNKNLSSVRKGHLKQNNSEINTAKSDNLENYRSMQADGSKNKSVFYIDSGATQHFIKDKSLFSELNTERESVKIIIANGESLHSQGIGTVSIQTKTSDGKLQNVHLQNVYYLPELESNLISVKKITDKGYSVVFEKDKCFIKQGNTTYVEAVSSNNSLYKVILNNSTKYEEENAHFTVNCDNQNCIMLWHRRLGHRNIDTIKQIVRENLADGIKLGSCNHQHEKDCVECIKNKISELPYPKETKYRANKPLDLVHTDLCGPMQTPSIGGKYYILTFIDDYSRFTMIYLLTHKNEVLTKLKEFIAVTKNKFGRTMKTLRSDNGKEYVNNEVEAFMKENGIRHQLTVPYSPQQNGVAERKNRTLVEMTRCLLAEGNLSHKFWGEAVMTATYIQNRLPTKANRKTPYELWTGRKPNLSHLRTYGARAFAHIHKSKRGKLEEKAVEGILVGYDNRSKGYRIYTSGNQIIISRTVRFIENKDNRVEIPLTRNQLEEKTETENETKEEITISPKEEESEKEEPRRSERTTKGKPPVRFTYVAEIKKEPNSYKEVQKLNDSEKKKWYEAMEDEMKSLEKNQTWELVNIPKNKKPIGSKWTYKAKIDENGKIVRYKARLVAKGYNQKFGTDYDETFAPVVKYTTVRAFLAAACYKRMHVKHVDIKTAFLHGELKEEIFMEQPEGYIKEGNEEKVYRLKKAIYGLKQAAKAWNEKLGNVLLKNGFCQSNADPCLFTKRENNEDILIILYVDDLLIASQEENKINEVIKMLENKFEVKNLGEVKYYLGINIRRTAEGNFHLNQRTKIEKLFENLEIEDQKPTYIPMKTSYPKGKQENNPFENNTKYRKAIGSLLYISTLTRPDISLAVNILSRKNESPTEEDWEAVVHVIRYLHTTKNLNLVISNDAEPVLTGYTDADWANDKTNRKSTGGNIFFIGKSPISWITKRQNCVALSSTESEYIAAAQAAMEIQWTIQLLKDLGLEQSLPIKLYEDNKSCIILSQNNKNSSRTKHVDVKYHYIRHLQEENILLMDYCNTKSMVADMLTKPLPKPQFSILRGKLNLKSLD